MAIVGKAIDINELAALIDDEDPIRTKYTKILDEFLLSDDDLIEVVVEGGNKPRDMIRSIKSNIQKYPKYRNLVCFKARDRVFVTYGEYLPARSSAHQEWQNRTY